jgi:D-glycero-alpha-D-manno-heptose 1-phosphate guanylyltransferase
MEAIILAGGLGTRLRAAVPDVPKCMAPVAGKPFIDHVIQEALNAGVTRFIFSLGYMHEVIEKHLDQAFPNLDLIVSVETHPLGTGGGIKAACTHTNESNCIVLNADTLFRVDLKKLMNYHLQHKAICSLALKPMHNFDRYGAVKINKDGFIQSFEEKKPVKEGLINGGVYVLNIPAFLSLGLPEKFSFEKDFLEAWLDSETMMGLVQEGYFVDIGIPEDFIKADKDLAA